MKLALTHLRVLFTVIILIAGSALGLAGQALGTAVEFGVAGDGVARPVSGSDQVTSHIVATDQSNHQDGSGQDCCINCAHAAGSACCPVGIPFASGCKVLDRALIIACGIVDAAFIATGIDPEALLQPPQIFA